MDIVEGLPKSRKFSVILVVVDRLTKYSHFIPLAHPFTTQFVAHVPLDNVCKLHGPSMAIVTDRDPIFTSKLWQDLSHSMKTDLHYSSTYHPKQMGRLKDSTNASKHI
jgi:hypothetical protein